MMTTQHYNNIAPIALFVYNRVWHTQQTIAALQKNNLAPISDLYIYADGAKNNVEDKKKVGAVREYISNIKGFKSVRVKEHKTNQGLANSIISGVTEIVNRHGRIIVLEDDLVTHTNFLEYMNDALDIFENQLDVISIHGYAIPQNKLPAYFFLRGADCWGWATWKRGWDIFNPNGIELLNQIQEQKLEKEFDLNGTYPYMKMLRDCINLKNSSWAIRWYASAFLTKKLTLHPGYSFVKNIGIDGSGTHITTPVASKPINDGPALLTYDKKLFYNIPIEESTIAQKLFERFFRKQNLSRKRRFYNFLISLLKRIIKTHH